MRFLAGSVAVTAAEQKLTGMREEFDKWRDLSASTDGEFSSTGIAGLMDQMR
jgi:hypothetical protein